MTERRGKPHPRHIIRDGSTLCGIPEHVLWGTAESGSECQTCVFAWIGGVSHERP